MMTRAVWPERMEWEAVQEGRPCRKNISGIAYGGGTLGVAERGFARREFCAPPEPYMDPAAVRRSRSGWRSAGWGGGSGSRCGGYDRGADT